MGRCPSPDGEEGGGGNRQVGQVDSASSFSSALTLVPAPVAGRGTSPVPRGLVKRDRAARREREARSRRRDADAAPGPRANSAGLPHRRRVAGTAGTHLLSQRSSEATCHVCSTIKEQLAAPASKCFAVVSVLLARDASERLPGTGICGRTQRLACTVCTVLASPRRLVSAAPSCDLVHSPRAENRNGSDARVVVSQSFSNGS